jgi:hypothetical protein
MFTNLAKNGGHSSSLAGFHNSMGVALKSCMVYFHGKYQHKWMMIKGTQDSSGHPHFYIGLWKISK